MAMSHSVTPVALAFLVVYGVAVAICGVLLSGTLALAVFAVVLVAVMAAALGVAFFRALDE